MLFRLKAAGFHLLGSGVVIGLFLWLVYGYWYMHPFQIIFSTIDVVKILIGVDLVLGPLLTFIVFNIAKSHKVLARDLGVILLVQLSALAWGVHVTYSVRPQYVVFYDKDVYVLTANNLDMSAVPEGIGERSFFFPPVSVYVQEPQNREEIARNLVEMLTRNKPDVPYQPERYKRYIENRDKVRSVALKADDLRNKSNLAKDWVDDMLASPMSSHAAFYKIESGSYKSFAAVDTEDGRVVSVMPDQPAPLPENKS